MARIAELDIAINADNRGLDSGIDSAQSKIGKLGSKLSSAGSFMTKRFTLPIVGGFALATKAAETQAKAEAAVETTIKSMGGVANVSADEVFKLASALQENSLFGDEAILTGQNLLLTFGNIRNEAGKGNDIFNRTSQMMVDMAEVFGSVDGAATMLGKALNDPVKGLTALSRVGVSFSQQQQKRVKQLVEEGDTLGAQKLILAELEKQYGGQAKAAADASSGTQQMMNAIGDAGEAIGAILLPVVQSLTGRLKGLAEWFQNLSPFWMKTVVGVLAVVAAAGPVLIILGKLITIVGRLIPLIGALGKALIFLATNPVGIIIVALAVLVVLVVKHWGTIKKVTLAVWNAILKAALKVWGALQSFFGAWFKTIVAIVSTHVAIWRAVVTTAWNAIRVVARTVWAAIRRAVIDPVRNVIGLLRSAWNGAKQTLASIWGAIRSTATSVWGGITGAIRTAVNTMIGILNTFIRAVNRVSEAVSKIPGVSLPTISEIPRLAHGTRNFPGGLAIVGERGPELVALPRGARVHSAESSARMGPQIHFHGPVYGWDDFERRVAEAMTGRVQAVTPA